MIIEKHHPNFKRLYFACMALSKDELKPALNNILIEESRIIGCDGHRVHITEGPVYPDSWHPSFKIEPGQYFPAKVTKSQIFLEPVTDPERYPDIDAIFPDLKNLETLDLKPVDDHRDLSPIDINYVWLVRLGVARCFNHKYVADMLVGADFTTVHLDPKSGNKAIVFKGKCEDVAATGLLMPIRIGD